MDREQATTAPEPGDSVVGLGVDQVNRRFAAACAAAGLEGRRTSAPSSVPAGPRRGRIQPRAHWPDRLPPVRETFAPEARS